MCGGAAPGLLGPLHTPASPQALEAARPRRHPKTDPAGSLSVQDGGESTPARAEHPRGVASSGRGERQVALWCWHRPCR